MNYDETTNNSTNTKSLELNPLEYLFRMEVSIQTIEKAGEKYIRDLEEYFSDNGFIILNAYYHKDKITHDRLSRHIKYGRDVLMVTLNLQKIVKNIHSSDYSSVLENEIYAIFSSFRNSRGPYHIEIDTLEYVKWINTYYEIYSTQSIGDNDKTNGDRIRECTNEELLEVHGKLLSCAIYSGGDNNRLLNHEDPEDFLLWLNKISDKNDDIIFEKFN